MNADKKKPCIGVSPAGVEYHGATGVTRNCKEALQKTLQFGDALVQAIILTHGDKHGFYLKDCYDHPVIILPGFTTGYMGEGPRGFSYSLALLEASGVPIDQVRLPKDMFERLENAALFFEDITFFEQTRPVRPSIYSDYIHETHWRAKEEGVLWAKFKPLIPLGLIEPRLVELARQFSKDPSDIVFKAIRLLESTVRRRTGSDEVGSKVFSAAFHGNPSLLYWPDIRASEQVGRGKLFTGTLYGIPKSQSS